MTTDRTIPVTFLRAALDAATQAGVDVDLALRRAQVPRALLEDRRARLSPEQAAQLVRWLWRLSEDEMLGMGLAPAPRGTFGLVAYALVGSEDLRTVWMRLLAFQRAVPGLPALHLTATESRVRVELDTADLRDPNHLFVDFIFVILQRFAGWMIGQRLRYELVELPYAEPRNAQEYDLIFGSPVQFGAGKAAVEFATDILDAPVVRSEADLLAYLQRAPADMLTQRDYGSSTAVRVRTILEKSLINMKWPTSDEVAKRLNLSTGHLRRVLRLEETSIGDIKEEILRDAAITALARGASVEEISQRLGFSEASAFRRAFKRWTGSTPAQYQRPN